MADEEKKEFKIGENQPTIIISFKSKDSCEMDITLLNTDPKTFANQCLIAGQKLLWMAEFNTMKAQELGYQAALKKQPLVAGFDIGKLPNIRG